MEVNLYILVSAHVQSPSAFYIIIMKIKCARAMHVNFYIIIIKISINFHKILFIIIVSIFYLIFFC